MEIVGSREHPEAGLCAQPGNRPRMNPHPLHVWIWQTGEPMPLVDAAERPMRALNATAALLAAGHRVTVWTADFNHSRLNHRFHRHTKMHDGALEVRFVHSRGYHQNLGAGRLIDHAHLALQLARLLRTEQPPDTALVGFPPIEAAAVMAAWLHSRSVPFLVDYKDQWPEVLLRATPPSGRLLGRVGLDGHYRVAHAALNKATGISSISDAFLDLALQQAGRGRSEWDAVFPLTAAEPPASAPVRKATAAWWDQQGVPADGRPRVVFVGSLSRSFEMRPVARAARLNPEIQFVICGGGSDESAARRLLGTLPNVVLPGRVDHSQSAELHRRATLALAPYAALDDFKLSIPNKVYDALMHGVPIATTLDGPTRTAVVERGAGAIYRNDDNSLVALVRALHRDDDRRIGMSSKALELFDANYSCRTVYGALTDHLELLAFTEEGRRASRSGA